MRCRVAVLVLVVAFTPTALPLYAQEAAAAASPEQPIIDLSLSNALHRAVETSEEVRLARSAVDAAQDQVTFARSSGLPQLALTGGYARTFQSPFQSGLRVGPVSPFQPDPNLPLEERVRYLEQNAGNAAVGALGSVFGGSGGLPLGRAHTYSLMLSAQQLLYAGGRVRASVGIAREGRAAAELTSDGTVNDIQLQVRSAYYRALLAQELESIAEAALVQAESFLEQERLRSKAGFASELDVLRADVSLENLRPQVVDAQNALQLSVLNVKRLVNVPLAAPVRLTTPLQIPTPDELRNPSLDPELVARQQATVQAAQRQVSAQQLGVRLARAARLPTVSLQSAYGGQASPPKAFALGDAPWQPDWTANVGVQVPVFTGFQVESEIALARVAHRQSELQLAQLRESVQVEYEQALGEKERASISIGARQRTVEQAQRVYDLTVLRYAQRQATELEVSQSRLELLQARSNLAQAIADFYIAGAGSTLARLTATTQPLPAPTTPTRQAALGGTTDRARTRHSGGPP